MSHIKDTTEKHRQSGQLSLEQLVDLLEHLNILAEIKCDLESPKHSHFQSKFIMPAVLKFASQKELEPSPLTKGCPLMINFVSGYVPFGVFCASTAYLIAHQDSMSLKWRLYDDQVMKNKVTFCVDRAFFTTLISRPQYLEIQVSRHPHARSNRSLADICSTVQQTVVGTLQTVILKMKYKPYAKIETPLLPDKQPFVMAFTCCLEDSHSDHLMKVVEENNSVFSECLKDSLAIDLKKEHCVWFGLVNCN